MYKLPVICLALLAIVLTFVYKAETRLVTLPRAEVLHAQAERHATTTQLHLSARSYLVFDNETGEELFTHDASSRHEMASVVKLITADTLFSESSSTLAATATIVWQSYSAEGESGMLELGERYTLRELVFPLLLSSSNDAAEAIAQARGESTFLKAMRARVKAVGMSSTTIDDPSGLSPRTTTTARDLMALLRFLYRENRHELDITTLPRYVGAQHTWQNMNPVSQLPEFLGGKQGHTDTAQSTLAALFSVSTTGRAHRTVGIVLLGSTNLEGDTKAVLKALQ